MKKNTPAPTKVSAAAHMTEVLDMNKLSNEEFQLIINAEEGKGCHTIIQRAARILSEEVARLHKKHGL